MAAMASAELEELVAEPPVGLAEKGWRFPKMLEGYFERRTKKVRAINDVHKRLAAGAEVLTDILQIADVLAVVDLEIRAALGLRTTPE